VSVLTVGETMALLDPLEDGELRLGMPLELRFAGAESNFAIALTRLGVRVEWVSRLGRDPFGDMIEAGLAQEGVGLRWLRRDDAPTGLFCKWRSGGRSHVTYRRAGSAASRLRPGDVPDEALENVRLVHLTGITMAISKSARELVLDVARRAKERGARVLFDPNFRPALPDTPEAAAARQRAVLPYVPSFNRVSGVRGSMASIQSPHAQSDAGRASGGPSPGRLGGRLPTVGRRTRPSSQTVSRMTPQRSRICRGYG
jgi:2-dehydro-3-deoxygluconokinase